MPCKTNSKTANLMIVMTITKEEKVDTKRKVIEKVRLTNYPINL
jgi:hypothetical protein